MKPISIRIQKKLYHFHSYRDLARFLMGYFVDDQLASLETKIDHLKSIMELLGFKSKANWVSKIYSEEFFKNAYWEITLSLEGLGTLPGFSVLCPIGQGDSNYNPERKRMSTDWEFVDKHEK